MGKANTTSWFGAVLAVLGELSMTEWLAILGFVLALISTLGGLALNYWYKRKMIEMENTRLNREFPVDDSEQKNASPDG